MEFPITKERLQNYRTHEAVAVETKQRVAKELQTICKEVETKVITTTERKYIYRIPSHVIRPSFRQTPMLPQPKNILEELLTSIKNTFPDSTITIDPLQTYIIIDWS